MLLSRRAITIETLGGLWSRSSFEEEPNAGQNNESNARGNVVSIMPPLRYFFYAVVSPCCL